MDVVEFFECVDEVQHLFGRRGVLQWDQVLGNHGEVSGLHLETGFLDLRAHGMQIGWGGAHLPGIPHPGHVFCAGLDGRHHQLILVGGPVDQERALAVELPCHGPGLRHGAAPLGERTAHVRSAAVPVVGKHVDQQGYATGGVALVSDLFIVDAVKPAGGPLDRLLNGLERDRRVTRLLKHGAQRRVHLGVWPTLAGSHLDLADELGEDLRPLGVGRALFVLDGRPFGMARHGVLLGDDASRPRCGLMADPRPGYGTCCTPFRVVGGAPRREG